MTRQFRKTVDIKTVDEDERTATGAVLVPDELDHQGDFLRPDAVRRFYADDVDTGVMHAAFPNDAAELERSEVIDEPETVGDEEFPAGTWIATREYKDDDLWELVKDGILTGFSIGGNIDDANELDAVPDDVRVPDAVPEETAEGPVAELVDGVVNEVSDVDIPAVPRATYKGGGDLGKSILDDVDGEDEFVAVMSEQRGHDESDARRLYQYLTDVRDDTGSETEADGDQSEVENAMSNASSGDGESSDNQDEPDDATKWRRFKSWLTGSDDGVKAKAESEAPGTSQTRKQLSSTMDDLVDEAADSDEYDDRAAVVAELASAADIDESTVRNIIEGDIECPPLERLEAFSDVLGVDVDALVTAAADECDYDIEAGSGEHGDDDEDEEDDDEMAASKTLEKQLTDEQTEIVADLVSDFASAHGDATVGDFRDWFWEMEFADELDPDEIVALTSAFEQWFDEMAADEQIVTGAFADWLDGQTDTEITMSNETEEPPAWAETLTEKVEQINERVTKLEGGDGEEADTESEKSLDDAPEWASALAEKVDDIEERVDTISKQSGHSQQLDGAEKDGGEVDEVDAFKANLVGATAGGDD